MRGVLTHVPGTAGLKLLFAVSRADLDGDATFLQRAMELVFRSQWRGRLASRPGSCGG